MRRDNLTMLSDFYQLTMANGYFERGYADKIVYFDLFFRKIPECGGFAIMAGLEQVIDYLKNLKFTDEDIEFLRAKKCFSEGFLEYLRNFKLSSQVERGVRSLVYPQEHTYISYGAGKDGERTGIAGAVYRDDAFIVH
mgnify:CR=1 FL=1